MSEERVRCGSGEEGCARGERWPQPSSDANLSSTPRRDEKKRSLQWEEYQDEEEDGGGEREEEEEEEIAAGSRLRLILVSPRECDLR